MTDSEKQMTQKDWKMVELTDKQMLQILMALNNVPEEYKAKFYDWDKWADLTREEINECLDQLVQENHSPRTYQEIIDAYS